MKLGDVMGGAYAGVAAQAADVEISGISSDSRQVKPGDLFFALAGTKADGAAYAKDAIARGAAAVVTGLSTAIPDAAVPVLKVDDPRRLLAISAANFCHAQPKTM